MKIVLCLQLLFVLPMAAQHGWPVEPTSADHPIGNSFGEFQKYVGDPYHHMGNDILVRPMLRADGTEDVTAPWIVVTVGGVITELRDAINDSDQGTTIAANGLSYRYWHLQAGSYDPAYAVAARNRTPVAAGDRIAKVYRWTACGYSHCHYDIHDGTNWISPYLGQEPNPDSTPPVIEAIHLARDNSVPWSPLRSVASDGCVVVNGLVDVVGQIRDTDDGGSTDVGTRTAWVRNLRWRACPDATPGCTWSDTHVYDSMPNAWGTDNRAFTAVMYSSTPPFISDSNYCSETWLYGVVTNFSGGVPNPAGSWNTNAIADGRYTVSLEATDFAGNTTVRNIRTCVQNGGGCTTDLAIRDATNDTGGVPSPGADGQSPDITANSTITIGTPTSIDVRVRNAGSCTLVVGTRYDVCLGWEPATATSAFPLPVAHRIGCRTETVGAGGMPVGTSRVTSLSWTPDAASVPPGATALIAWVDHASDPVRTSADVIWDNNRARQNIEFVTPP